MGVSFFSLKTVFIVKFYELAVRGDISLSGTVNSRDIKALMSYLTDSDILTGCRLKAADLNADNVVNTQDLVLLARECG